MPILVLERGEPARDELRRQGGEIHAPARGRAAADVRRFGMDRIRIRGGRPLEGEIPIGGAKNAALPLMTAGMLTHERLLLPNVPRLADIATMSQLVAQHGVRVEPGSDRTLSIGGSIGNTEAPY